MQLFMVCSKDRRGKMSREIRRVPPNWVHPCYEPGERQGWDNVEKPLYDESYEDAIAKWISDASDWVAIVQAGGKPEHGWYVDNETEEAWARANPYKAYATWYDSPPNPDTHRDVFTEQPTAYQIYETVSEGTPISPVFIDEDAMIAWMMEDHPYPVNHPSYGRYLRWEKISEQAARRFIGDGSVPSFFFSPQTGVVEGPTIYDVIGREP